MTDAPFYNKNLSTLPSDREILLGVKVTDKVFWHHALLCEIEKYDEGDGDIVEFPKGSGMSWRDMLTGEMFIKGRWEETDEDDSWGRPVRVLVPENEIIGWMELPRRPGKRGLA